jgi:hypothetical protein
MLRKGYGRKGLIEKKISGCESQGVWRQDELIRGKQLVVKQLWIWLWKPCVHFQNNFLE